MAATSGLAKVNVNDTRFLQRQMSWWVINFFCTAMDTWCRVCPCFKAKALHSMRWWWLGVIVATGQSEMYLLQWVWLILQCQRLHDSKIQYSLPNKYVCYQDQDYLTLNSGSKPSPVRYVLKIHFFIEFGPKMIQFKIQFKTKSKIFIQKNIHSKQNPKYSFKKIFIQ